MSYGYYPAQYGNNAQYGSNPPYGSNNPDYPTQPMPSYMFPYQNYMGASMTNIYDEYNNRGGMIDNLIIQNQSTPQD